MSTAAKRVTTPVHKPRSVEQIDFHGVTIEALPPLGDGKVWISVRRVCEALGIDRKNQQEKLETKEWAVTTSIAVHYPDDGQARTIFCIDLDSLPMWLATIEASRVKPRVRPLLVKFQRECARALRDHFFSGLKFSPVADCTAQSTTTTPRRTPPRRLPEPEGHPFPQDRTQGLKFNEMAGEYPSRHPLRAAFLRLANCYSTGALDEGGWIDFAGLLKEAGYKGLIIYPEQRATRVTESEIAAACAYVLANYGTGKSVADEMRMLRALETATRKEIRRRSAEFANAMKPVDEVALHREARRWPGRPLALTSGDAQ